MGRTFLRQSIFRLRSRLQGSPKRSIYRRKCNTCHGHGHLIKNPCGYQQSPTLLTIWIENAKGSVSFWLSIPKKWPFLSLSPRTHSWLLKTKATLLPFLLLPTKPSLATSKSRLWSKKTQCWKEKDSIYSHHTISPSVKPCSDARLECKLWRARRRIWCRERRDEWRKRRYTR